MTKKYYSSKLFMLNTAFVIILMFLQGVVFAGTKGIASLDSSSDYLVYYGSFDENKVLQAQYFDLVIVDINGITAEQVDDIKNGFDNTTGTGDDVTVIGYLSIGEQDGALRTGDGTGPVYWDGTKIVYENKGYASYYLDDKDRNGMPDQDGIWNSWYVNAGDSAWWVYNTPAAEDILTAHHCDGLFLDLVDTGGPNTWGLPYQWTAEGMIKYIEFLRRSYPSKYILANRGIFYFDPAITSHFKYADRYRTSIDGLMIESYYSTWDWNKSIGYYNPEHVSLRSHYAPLLNAQAKKTDGFNMFILDYMSHSQPNHDALLDTVVKVTERDQGWLISVSPILLDSIWFDVYNHHMNDNNPPAWPKTVGASRYKWEGNNLVIYFDKAADQTLPVRYDLYFSESEINFNSAPQYPGITPETSDVLDYKYIITGLDPAKTYNAAIRAADNFNPPHKDMNRKILKIIPGAVTGIKIDGFFDDWTSLNQVDNAGSNIELPGDTTVSPSCDLVDVWFSQDSLNFYFAFSAAGEIKANPYFYHVLIDEDNDTSTGYHTGGSFTGTDIMCENGYLWRYSGTNGEWSWEYLGQVNYKLGDGNKKAEMAIPRNNFHGNPSSISFIYHIANGTTDIPADYAPDNYTETSYHSSDFTGVNEHADVPGNYRITTAAYPNPFNPAVTIAANFNRPLQDNLVLNIYDITGRIVLSEKINVNGQSEARFIWSPVNTCSSGIYLYRLEGTKVKFSVSGKMVYIK